MTRLSRSIEIMADECLSLAAQLAHNAEEIAKRAHDDTEGISSPVNERRNSHYADDGSIPGPTPAKAIGSRTDQVLEDTKRLLAHLKVAVASLRAAKALAGTILPLDPLSRQMAEKRVVSGDYCANAACGRFVHATREDRLRAGRCSACYSYRLRTGNDRRDVGSIKT